MQRFLSVLIYVFAAVAGAAAFVYPFLLPAIAPENFVPRSDAPLLAAVLLTLCLGALLVEAQGQAINAKIIAALGVLTAMTAALRFIEVAIPGPGGFSPIFAPIILAGYVFGPRFGFLMGASAMFTSALITGSVGPWLPYQMFAAGWIGLTAGWLPDQSSPRHTAVLLAAFGFLWGLLYGALLNLYFWPFVAGADGLGWSPGAGWRDGLSRYFAFYVVTSLIWDLGRASGNAALLLAVGAPAAKALARFRDRFHFQSEAL